MSVRDVLRALASYPNQDELLAEFPDLEQEDLHGVLAFAAAMTDWDEVAWRPPAA